MKHFQYRNWWSLGLKGILILLIGLVAVAFPAVTVIALATYFGIVIVVAGGFILAAALINSKKSDGRKLWIIEGLIDLVIGIILIAYPKQAAGVLFVFFGIYALIMGIFQLMAFFRIKKYMNGTSMVLLNGIISILFALALLTNPFWGGVALTSVFGIFAIIYGIIAIFNSIRFSTIR